MPVAVKSVNGITGYFNTFIKRDIEKGYYWLIWFGCEVV